jgi:hypothetical protein
MGLGLAQRLKEVLLKPYRPLFARISAVYELIQKAPREVHRNSCLVADLLIDRIKTNPAMTLRDSEFAVFSQWGEDGILQYLIARVPIENQTFIEFGVEDYLEANTRFLLMHQNWSGLVIDGSEAQVDAIKRQDVYWRHDLTAVHAFITRENINELIGGRFHGDVGVLSIDVDGNDYWVWEAIEVVSPRIVICEYNSVFGAKRAVTVPYDPKFFRTEAHFSNLYFGASLPALHHLATRKGYVFVGCTKAGNDAFFVRQDLAHHCTALTVEEGYIFSKARESRNSEGRFDFVSGEERLKVIAHLNVFDVEQQKLVRLAEVT